MKALIGLVIGMAIGAAGVAVLNRFPQGRKLLATDPA